mgnify:CR=1 FL=1|tara:strand:- start:238 stop:834 length:597 start_codon:yes stop_codon:yes gene_type:complete
MIKLVIANDKVSKDFIKETITNYHSYVPSTSSVGRRIDWVVFNDDKPIGMIGIGSSVYPPPKDILKHTKLSIKEYKNKFNSFANNWRFCMRESIRNAGTQILKELRRQAPLYWKQKYNDDLLYLITFVAGGNNGAVYKADNWSQIGQTSGLPPHKSISMKWDTHESLKEKYVKPTGENKKLIFFKRIRTKQEHLSSKT